MDVYPILVALMVLFAVPTISESFGHGLGGDVAPPLDLDGRDVTVSAELTPFDLSARDTSDASLKVKFFDVEADEPFDNVTYRIQVWKTDELIANNLFFDKDGTLDVELRTRPGDTKYYGSEHPSAPGALYAQGQNNVVIQGPIFDRGGLYNIKVGILGATSPRTILASELNYDTFISVADVQPFTIRTAHAEVEATIKTYYDKVSNIQYDEARESISFEMPFDWSPDYVELVQIVHEEIQVPKSFSVYAPERGYAGYVDGVRLDNRVLIVDPHTYEDRNVIHFLVTTKEIQRINTELGPEHEKSEIMRFELVPEDNIQKNTTEFYLVDADDLMRRTGATVSVSWEADISSGTVPLEVTFFDESGDLLRDARYGYVLVNHVTDTELLRSLGDDSDLGNIAIEGIDIIDLDRPGSGTYRIDVLLYGQGRMGLDFDDTYAGIGSGLIEFGGSQSITPGVQDKESILIPNWIRNIAEWWSDGTVGDEEFVSALEFLIEQKVINVSVQRDAGVGGDASIPSWIKRTAGWWSDGTVGDADFVNSLEFLIQKGIIVVGKV